MTSPPAAVGGRAVRAARRVAGGDLNDAWAVELEGGGRAFVKARAGEYATEAAGLRWLAAGGALVPEVLEAADGFLALAWLEPGPLGPAGEEELGRTLAAVHRAGAPAFGAAPPGAPGGELRLGPLTFPAGTAERWPALHAAHHLAPLVPRAGLTAAGARAVAAVCERLEELAGPPEPPARLHGDLWSGNVHPSGGRAYLVDPAAYGGHREVDLAMLDLFGRMPARARAAYEEAHPLPAGHEDRVALWQLFPLLVHAVLFGGSYAAAAERAARRYV